MNGGGVMSGDEEEDDDDDEELTPEEQAKLIEENFDMIYREDKDLQKLLPVTPDQLSL